MNRPHIPLSIKLAAALIALGFHPKAAAKAAKIKLPKLDPLYLSGRRGGFGEEGIDWDHLPALELRRKQGSKYHPDANDPRFLVPLPRLIHRRKTDGDPAKPLSGDKGKIAKAKRLEYSRLGGAPRRSKRKWPRRAFPKRGKTGDQNR